MSILRYTRRVRLYANIRVYLQEWRGLEEPSSLSHAILSVNVLHFITINHTTYYIVFTTLVDIIGK